MTTIIKKITFFCAVITWHMFLANINIVQAQIVTDFPLDTVPTRNIVPPDGNDGGEIIIENPPITTYVGAVPGAVDVSPMGAATYTVPIEVVPGTQGMQPNLSIVYNSFGGMGLLGMKWNLTGLSAITRCGQTPYYDNGNITAIQFNSNDRFALDGDRLHRLNSGVYGAIGGEYATEIENFTRIVSYDGTSGHPEYFLAYTDDGTIVEYGNGNNSKQRISNVNTYSLAWYVSKITDANGNYMRFYYKPTTYNGEILIDSISYTGNSNNGMKPYAKVVFSYENLPYNLGKNTCLVGGYGVSQTNLLNTITVFYSKTMVRKYLFYYNLSLYGERTAHLTHISITGEASLAHINSTIITWGENNSSISIEPAEQIQELDNAPITTGDFNGDGYTDIVFYGIYTNGSYTWKLYLYDTLINNYTYITSGWYAASSSTISAHDINGDGKDDLVVTSKNEYPNVVAGGITVYSIDGGSANIIFSLDINDFYSFSFGDIDGNGTANIIYLTKEVEKKAGKDKITWTTHVHGMGVVTSTVTDNKNLVYNVEIIDANGNGKKNIRIYDGGRTRADIYEYNHLTSNFSLLYTETTVYTGSIGDVNGDGITDRLVQVPKNNASIWKLFLAKGDGTFLEYEFPYDLSTQSNATPAVLCDINGDGKDDIIQTIIDLDNKTTTFKILLTKGWVESYKYSTVTLNNINGVYNLFYMQMGDFNGDGRADVLLERSEGESFKILKINQDSDYEFVKKIRDRMGKAIQLNYKHGYFRAPNKKLFIPVTEWVKVSNGIGNNYNTLQYRYVDPKFSYIRRIFLGFEKFICADIQENKEKHLQLALDNTKQTLKPVSKTVYYDYQIVYNFGELLNQTNYTYSFFNVGGTRYVPFVSETTVLDQFSDIKTQTIISLNSEGRMEVSNTKTYNGTNVGSWLHSETNTYTYKTIILNDKQKKTVPLKTITKQQYGNSNIELIDTLTYTYYPDNGSNKGRLHWERKGNIDGSITTTYENYITAGLYGKKTISAQGCFSRAETYTYDVTQRFVTKIINPIGHEGNLTYDPKTGNKLTETDANGLQTSYIYDPFGNLKQVNHPDGTQTKDTIYWLTGNNPPNVCYCVTTTSTGKPVLTVFYDLLGREVCRLDDGYYYDTHYNNKGQVAQTSYPYIPLTKVDGEKTWHKFTYDIYGRKSTENAPYTNISYAYNKRKITVTRNNVYSWQTTDALGRIDTAYDSGGYIYYNYAVTSAKRHQTKILTNGAITTILSDLWGNRLSIHEPNANEITSSYNKFNELMSQIDARGNTTTYQYDNLGRVTQKKFTAQNKTPLTYTYTYDSYSPTNKGRGKIYQISKNDTLAETFLYDTQGRLAKHTKQMAGIFEYTYTPNGQLHTLKYPGDFKVTYSYTSTGKLKDIRRSSDNSLIYKPHSRNVFGETTLCEYGNGLASHYTYNSYGLLTRINTGKPTACSVIIKGNDEVTPKELGSFCSADSSILNYRYTYDNNKGLMLSRTESIVNIKETYTYDPLDRLTSITTGSIGQTGITQTFSYHNNGNILSNSQLGSYNYMTNGSTKPHAVTCIQPIDNNVISDNLCTVNYNFFNQPTQITDVSATLDKHWLKIDYGANQQRIKTIKYRNDSIESTRYYFNKYSDYQDTKIDSGSLRQFNNYIYGDNGVVALNITVRAFTNGTLIDSTTNNLERDIRGSVTLSDSTYYIHTDHLGSYCAITNANRQVKQHNYFDPWGNHRALYRGISPPQIPLNFTLTQRGFTGHEHYPYFKIINMNGRLYDPVIGRFFSPDQYVANSSFTQDFNRYTYARNCPLMYTDPSGESLVGILVGAFIGGMMNMMMNAENIQNNWQAFAYFGIGALAAGAGAAAGTAAFAWSGVSGFGGGFVAGVAGGFTGGLISGAGNAWTQGVGFGQGLLAGIGNGVKGGVIGGITGGVKGGIQAKMRNASFWDGYFEHNFTSSEKPITTYELAMSTAEGYNGGEYANILSNYNNTRMDDLLNFKVGDLGFDMVTTETPNKVGLMSNGKYLTSDYRVLLGKCSGIIDRPETYVMHISPFAVLGDDVTFRAIAGHEIIHAYHINVFGNSFYNPYSEGVAYRYSFNTYINAGRFNDALKVLTNISNNGFYYPSSYRIPYGLKWLIY